LNQQYITLLSLSFFENKFLEDIGEVVKHEFFFPVSIKETRLDLSEFYDAARRQYNGNKLLKEIDAFDSPGSVKIMGLFSIDLFIPILTYIFGQAYLGGRSGIASVYRLSNERYGMKSDPKLLLERFKKEVIHELGHTFGLLHCHGTTCVMRSSTYVEDIDQKNHSFCADCRAKMGLPLS